MQTVGATKDEEAKNQGSGWEWSNKLGGHWGKAFAKKYHENSLHGKLATCNSLYPHRKTIFFVKITAIRQCSVETDAGAAIPGKTLNFFECTQVFSYFANWSISSKEQRFLLRKFTEPLS